MRRRTTSRWVFSHLLCGPDPQMRRSKVIWPWRRLRGSRATAGMQGCSKPGANGAASISGPSRSRAWANATPSPPIPGAPAGRPTTSKTARSTSLPSSPNISILAMSPSSSRSARTATAISSAKPRRSTLTAAASRSTSGTSTALQRDSSNQACR